MDEIKSAVSRIDENVRLLREEVKPLVELSRKHSEQIAILQNDKKWASKIVTTIFGLIGIIIGALAEFLRK